MKKFEIYALRNKKCYICRGKKNSRWLKEHGHESYEVLALEE